MLQREEESRGMLYCFPGCDDFVRIAALLCAKHRLVGMKRGKGYGYGLQHVSYV